MSAPHHGPLSLTPGALMRLRASPSSKKLLRFLGALDLRGDGVVRAEVRPPAALAEAPALAGHHPEPVEAALAVARVEHDRRGCAPAASPPGACRCT